MSILSFENLSQNFGAFDLFSGLTGFIPNDGKIGLVGPNGVGKTTLLGMLIGTEKSKTGSVTLARSAKLGYLQQEAMLAFQGRENNTVRQEMFAIFDHLKEQAQSLRQMEEQIAAGDDSAELYEIYSHSLEAFEQAGGYTYETRINQVLDGLGFDRANWDTALNVLSGGQKTRALLAKLILEKPNLLILDEPTNHLDVDAIEWLENTLKNWDGAILLVSHDRYFLDRVVNTIWEMSATHIELYRGNYSAYVQQRAERWERREKEFEAVKERFEKEIEFIKKNIAGQNTNIAQGKLSRLTRELRAVEEGGLALLNSGKNWSELGVGRQRPLSVAEAEERIRHLPRPRYRPFVPHLRLDASHRSGNIVLRTHKLVVGYPNAPLFTADDIVLDRLECAALIGPNGSGKTTFLRTILEKLTPLAGEVQLGASLQVGYFSQAHDSLNLDNSVLDELLRHQHMMISEARDYLGQYLFRGDDVYKKVRSLSGGERGRLALSILALQKANFLLLDEPTNHLDVTAQELLQTVLEKFEGTILLVSHDRYLIDYLATQIWEVRDGKLNVFTGRYQEYLAHRAGAKAPAEVKPIAPPPTSNTPPKLSKNELMRRAKVVEELEKEIAALESKVETVSQELHAAGQAQDFDKMQSKSIEYNHLHTQLEALIEKWEKTASEYEMVE